jgi:hypothetical protein
MDRTASGEEEEKIKRDRQQQEPKGDPVMTYTISAIQCTKSDMAH